MASVHSFSFDAFPNDDKIYRLYWAGQTQLSNTEDDSPKIFAWLKEVDAEGRYLPNVMARLVIQSAGAIPSLYIGSLWQNQSQFLSSTMPDLPLVELEIEAQPFWTAYQAGNTKQPATADTKRHDWINPSDYPLKIHTSDNAYVAGYNSWVVPMRTTDGREVVIPCYELFRAFYAGSSELAWRLLTAPWSKIQHYFVNHAEITELGEGRHKLVLDPVLGVGRGVMPFISAFILSKAVRQCANRIQVDLVAESQGNGDQTAWIRAVPPFLNQRFRILARVQELQSRDGLLVTKIERGSFPVDFSRVTVTYLEDEYLPEPSEEEKKDKTGAQCEATKRQEPPESARVKKSGTRRPSARRWRLGIGKEFWLNGPELKKAIRETKRIPRLEKKEDESPVESQPVGLGGAGDHKSAKHGSLEYCEKLENIDRMAAIQALIARLTGSVIDRWTEWPLVRQTTIEGNTFCAFPTDKGDAGDQAWASGYRSEDDDLPRLAWVVRLVIENQAVYWVEVEHIKNNERYCSIIFQMLNNVELDGNTLLELLTVCVTKQGCWPKYPPEPLSEKLRWVKARHYTNDKGGLRTITITKRLDQLGVVRKKH